ncbi:MAG: translocation/assembly module TamB domain-containing protein, partial [Spirochaetaceae bacterium]|nr:translocation/assembly module TamB domain-containing protein [Spirochaetaceae bacterium]
MISENVSVPLKNGRLVSEFDIRGMVARRDWDIYIDMARLKWTDRTDQSDIAVEMNGTINPGRVVLPDIKLSDSLGNLSGNAFFESTESGNRMQGRLFMGGDEDEIYELAFIRDDDFWDVGLNIEAAHLERAMRERLSGRLNVNGRMTGSLDDPLISLNMETRDGYLDGQPLDARGIVSMESGRVRLQDVHYAHEGMALSRGLFLLNLTEGSLRTTAELNATYNQVPVSSGFSLAVDFGRGFTIPELSELVDSDFIGTLATRPVLWDADQHLPAFTFQFMKDSEVFRVQTPDADILNAEYGFKTGELDIVSGGPMPVIVRGGGTVKDGQIDLSFPELEIDPVLINYAMFRDPILLQYHVIFQSGRFVGNLDIIGSSSNPGLYGEIRADNLKVDTPYTYAVIKPASTDIHFDGHRITIDRIEIPVGDGIIYGEGHIVLDRLNLVEFDMIYGGKPKGKGVGVPVYYPLMGVNLDGIFTGEVHMTGGDKRFFLEGDFTFPYLKASLGSPIIPVNQAKEDVYPAAVFLDLNFITGNNCVFFLPNEQFKIVRATAEPDQIINLVYSNAPNNLSLTGNLSIKTGDIFYFDRDFQISEGSLRFNESLGSFDPILALRAETKVRDDEGEDVTVALVYNAPVMSDFNPR